MHINQEDGLGKYQKRRKVLIPKESPLLLGPFYFAGVAQLVEHHLAKVAVASSSLVTRSPSPRLPSSLCKLRRNRPAGMFPFLSDEPVLVGFERTLGF